LTVSPETNDVPPTDAIEDPQVPTEASQPQPSRVARAKSWGGYAWFMSFGTILPLPIFLAGYVTNLTLVGTPVARRFYRFGVFTSTLGQSPPGADKVKEHTGEGEGKKPFVQRVKDHSPAGWVERRGKPPSTAVRVVWFVFVGWWLGIIWVVLAWSVLLLPYPFPGMIRDLLDDLPSVMTLGLPRKRAPERGGSDSGLDGDPA
jgi:uncharacterized membrane protein YccF (DUF307 family)